VVQNLTLAYIVPANFRYGPRTTVTKGLSSVWITKPLTAY